VNGGLVQGVEPSVTREIEPEAEPRVKQVSRMRVALATACARLQARVDVPPRMRVAQWSLAARRAWTPEVVPTETWTLITDAKRSLTVEVIRD